MGSTVACPTCGGTVIVHAHRDAILGRCGHCGRAYCEGLPRTEPEIPADHVCATCRYRIYYYGKSRGGTDLEWHPYADDPEATIHEWSGTWCCNPTIRLGDIEVHGPCRGYTPIPEHMRDRPVRKQEESE